MSDNHGHAEHIMRMTQGIGLRDPAALVGAVEEYLDRNLPAKVDRVSQADAQEAVYSAAVALATNIGADKLHGEAAKQAGEALEHIGSAVAKATWGEYGFSDQQTITDYRYTSFNGGKVGDAQRPAGFAVDRQPHTFVPPTTPEERP